jgi:hypothetical protein
LSDTAAAAPAESEAPAEEAAADDADARKTVAEADAPADDATADEGKNDES